MKIAIITFSEFKDNYGQILQAYALQEFFRKKNIEAGHIRFTRLKSSPEKVSPKRKKATFALKGELRSFIVQNIIVPYRQLLNRKFRKQYPVSFADFEHKYIRFYPRVYDCLADLQKYPHEAECYVCGSDQIWNTGTSANSRAFYLDFGGPEIKRIAYAPSFGRSQLPLDDSPFYQEQLSRLDKISVRELEGIGICKRLGFDATQVIDPSFLLTKTDYLKLCQDSSIASSDIFCYFLNFRSSKEVYWKCILSYCHSKSYSCNVTIASGAYPAMGLLRNAVYKGYEPQDWLKAIDQCQYMITNSFHGLAFAIIMEKPFLVIPLNGSAAKMNGRISSLLSLLNLEDRLYNPHRPLAEQIEAPIDWESVASILESERRKSANFLEI